MTAADTGISSGHLTAADLFFLISAILAAVGAIIAYPTKTLWATVVAAAICAASIGLLLL